MALITLSQESFFLSPFAKVGGDFVPANHTKTKEEVLDKEKMKMIAIYTASFVPGWNIACWSVGLGLYCLTNVARDEAKACRFTRLVLGAPATLPVMAYEKLTDREIL